MDRQELFQQLNALRGKPLRITAASLSGVAEGQIEYVSFDSFLLSTSKGRELVRFDDLVSIETPS